MGQVIVIGGANIDVKGRSRARLIAGTSNPGDVVVSVGGVGRNIAHNLALLEVDVAFIGLVGDDAQGERLKRETEAAGVDVSMLGIGGASTGIYLAVLDEQGELVSAINDMRCTEALRPAHLARHAKRLETASMIVADCNIGVDCLAWLAERHHAKLLIEPISVPKSQKLRGLKAFAVTPNQSQLEALGDAIADLHRMGFANVIVHRGKAGVTVSDGASQQDIAAVKVDGVTDVTGAGDAAVAGLVCGLVSGHALGDAARLGQAAAALKIQSKASVAAGMTRARMFELAGLQA